MPLNLNALLRESVIPGIARLERNSLVIPRDLGKKSVRPFIPHQERLAAASVVLYPYRAEKTLEFAYCLSGRVGMVLDDRFYVMDRGDLAVIRPGTKHQERVIPGGGSYELLWVIAYTERITLHVSSWLSESKFTLSTGASLSPVEPWITMLERAAAETRTGLPEWEVLVRARLSEFFALLCRHVDKHGLPRTRAGARSDSIQQAQDFIRQRYSRSLTLQTVATHVSLSPNYLSARFTKTAGMTVMEFLREVRLEEAERLLIGSDRSIAEIGRRVGIHDPTHFGRLFRARTGHSPRAYRKAALKST